MASNRKDHATAKNTICLWYDKDAEAAARFYAKTFPDSEWAPSTAHPATSAASRATCWWSSSPLPAIP